MGAGLQCLFDRGRKGRKGTLWPRRLTGPAVGCTLLLALDALYSSLWPSGCPGRATSARIHTTRSGSYTT
jgi:hypothetical protein